MTRFAPPRRRVRRRLLDVPVHRGARRVVGKVALALVECDGYFVDMDGFIMCATLYDPHRRHARDPCAWPYPRKHQTWRACHRMSSAWTSWTLSATRASRKCH